MHKISRIHPGTVLIAMINYERCKKFMSSGSGACSLIWYEQEITHTIFWYWTSRRSNLLVSSKRKTKAWFSDNLLNWWYVMSCRPESTTCVIEDELNRENTLVAVQANNPSAWDSGILWAQKNSGVWAQRIRPGITSTIIFFPRCPSSSGGHLTLWNQQHKTPHKEFL